MSIHQRITASILAVAGLAMLLPPAAIAAPPEPGGVPPLVARGAAGYQWQQAAADYVGPAMVRRPCFDEDPRDDVRPDCNTVLPTRSLVYRRAQGEWLLYRPYSVNLQGRLFMTRPYAGNWNWVWSPDTGLLLFPRQILAEVPTS